MQLDDWVLCRIYEKCTHAQRASKEHDNSSVEEVLASLPEIDDMLPHSLNSVGGVTESAQQQQQAVAGYISTSENGYLSGMIQRGMMAHHNNTGVVSTQENLQTASTLTNEWKRQQSMDTTYGNHHSLEKFRYNMMASSQELASASSMAQRQPLTMRPDMAMGQFQQHTQKSYNNGGQGKPALRSASDEEVQSTFRCSSTSAMRGGFGSSNEGSLEAMFPAMGYDPGNAQSTLSYGHPSSAMATSWFNSSYDSLS